MNKLGRHFGLSWVLVSLLMAYSAFSSAQDVPQSMVWDADLLAEVTPILSSEEAADIARQSYAGKVMAVKYKPGPNGGFYRVKMLSPKGKVKLIKVNAQSGRVSK